MRSLNILSTPRLVARSGSEAQILVGTDVPIITSQRAADNQTGGDTDILQTVQYRQTGVILNMRPVVYGEDRVDIELFQEVSSQEPNRTSSISSPLILNRSVTTQLSLREGMTAVIGGLIQDNYSREQRGVPLLKDAPLIGAAFRSDAVAGSKVELLILVTPYILRTDDEVQDATSVYSTAMNRALRLRGPRVYTLLPWRTPFSQDRIHGGALAPGSTREPATAPSVSPNGAEAR
jgi:general secretion pathway protein D